MIQYRCACGRMLQAEEAQAGQQARCPSCAAVGPVPGRGESVTADPPRDDRDDHRPLRRRREEASGGQFPVLLVALGVGAAAVLICGGVAVGLLLPAVQKVREAAQRMQEQNNFKQMAIAMHNLHDVNNQLPRPAIESPDGKPLLSWRVAILPYVEQQALYQQFRLNEPWDSDHNKQFIAMMPKIYMRPNDPPSADGKTHYQAIVGKGFLFDYAFVDRAGKRVGRRLMEIPDGTSNTVMFVVAKTPVVWTKPEDIDADDGAPLLPRLDTRFNGTTVATTDGAVRLVRPTSEATLRAALTAAGGEVLGPDW